ncbi:MAG: hypothetical protein GKR89_29235 [Candidatus Latescibacteria bacterium]|nr:hypothetical protein [Candidatus Latescibacterota bacterium]
MEAARPKWSVIVLEEPFRLFFPLGVVGGLVGVFLTFSPQLDLGLPPGGLHHGLLQIQGFVLSFAVGFLMTALPRFVEAPQARGWELGVSVGLLAGSAVALVSGHWRLAEFGFVALLIHLVVFALRRLRKGQDNPPPSFILVGVGLLSGLAGGGFLLYPLSGFNRLGPNLLEQGLLVSLVLGVGSYLGPRLLYGDRGSPQTQGPLFRRGLWGHGTAGLLLLGSFVLEAGWDPVWGRLLRAVVVAGHLLVAVGIHRLPRRRLGHLYLLWLSLWCLPGGICLAGLFPAYEVAMLHITFIGGFGLITLVIASRVVVAHCDLEAMWDRHAGRLVWPGLLLLLSAAARVGADLLPQRYVFFLHGGAGLWLIGLVLWGRAFVPKLGSGDISPDD